MKKYHIILASNSPRRRELLGGLGIPFDVKVLPDVSESYPDTLPVDDTAQYIAEEKAAAYRDFMQPDDLVITADTVVICAGQVLGVCLSTVSSRRSFSVRTEVTFKPLTDEEIDYYVRTYRPLDKAGAYGIQEWIGYIGVTGLNGSYFNVMGLPVQRIYEELRAF